MLHASENDDLSPSLRYGATVDVGVRCNPHVVRGDETGTSMSYARRSGHVILVSGKGAELDEMQIMNYAILDNPLPRSCRTATAAFGVPHLSLAA